MNGLTISVSQLNEYIKKIFDAEEMLIGINVVGEITNLKQSGKSTYFDLKDESASLPCVAFDSTLLKDLEIGDKVTIKGKLNYYIKGGRLTFVVSKVEKYGLGDLYKQFLLLKEKLEKQGIFDEKIKKELPKYPKRIGVVTSRTGAVIRDIIRVARNKNKSTDIVLFPAKVQGIGAKEEIIKGIKVLDEMGLDAIIVARGGGSFEDYQPFNSEDVVMAVFNAKTPIISAIGHENDWSLIDFAADKRAGTPSIASDMAFNDEFEHINKLMLLMNNVYSFITHNYLKQNETIVNRTKIISQLVISKLEKLKYETEKGKNLLYPLVNQKLESFNSKLNLLHSKLESSNPASLLQKGYIKAYSFKNEPIFKIADVKLDEEIKLRLCDGVVIAKAIKKEQKNG